ncbi:Embryonic pepsinogen [Galdieria sulphuraria]|nr:Embryonic pepsinogen [Galdieria sulphuraria]
MKTLSRKKVEQNESMSWVSLATHMLRLLPGIFLFLVLCCPSGGQTSRTNNCYNTLRQRTLIQMGNELFLEPRQNVVRKQMDNDEILVIPLAYRVPLGRQDILRNIFTSESRKRHLLGNNRENLFRQLEQRVIQKNNDWEDSPRFQTEESGIGVKRYFEQVVLGNVVNMAEYYVSLQVNGESFYVQLDTGSSNLLISTTNCSHCQANKKLQLNGLTSVSCSSSDCCQQSSSCCSKQDPSLCGVLVEYGSGFASGALVKGTVTISNISVYTTFGGILNSSSDFEPTSVSGILGMASSQLACNPTCVTPLFDAIVQQKSIANVFSVLLNPDNGVLVLGGVDGNFSNGSISYTDMPSSDPGYYEVTVSSVSVDGDDVYQTSFTAVVDTGTTLVYLPETCYNDLVKYFQSHYNNSFWDSLGALLGSLSSSYISSLPNVDIQLSGSVKVSIPPDSYLVSVGDGNYMFGIQSSGGSSSILVDVKSVNLSNVPGVVVAGVLGAILLSMAVFLLVRRRRKSIIPRTNVWSSQPYVSWNIPYKINMNNKN